MLLLRLDHDEPSTRAEACAALDGSTFYFTARLPKADAPAVHGEAHGAAESSSVHGRRLKVLLAEDNPVNTKITVRLLEKHDCDVVAVADGRAAVDAAQVSPFDVILMDLQMPIMDGFEATRHIRAGEEQGRRVPIVALTASAMKDDEHRCYAADMDAHLSKPLEASRIAELLSVLRGGRTPELVVAPEPRRGSVDLRLVRERCDNDREILREVVEAYRESCKGGIGELERARVGADVGAAHRAAHQLRGAFLYVAASDAARLADQIEHLDEASVGSLQQLIDSLKQEAAAVEALLLEESLRQTAVPPTA